MEHIKNLDDDDEDRSEEHRHRQTDNCSDHGSQLSPCCLILEVFPKPGSHLGDPQLQAWQDQTHQGEDGEVGVPLQAAKL